MSSELQFSVKGLVSEVKAPWHSSSGKFKKQDVILAVGDKVLSLEFPYEGIKLVKESGVEVGDVAAINFELSSREWQGKHFTGAIGIDITVISKASDKPGAQAPASSQSKPDDDDVPF